MTSDDDVTEYSLTAPTDYDSTDFISYKPGTIQQRGSDRPTLRYLNRYVVAPITPIWFDVGLELTEAEKEDELRLEAIRTEPTDKQRTTKMLQFWLEKNHKASWNDLIETLKIPNIGLHTTAHEIERMLLPESNNSVQLESEVTCRSDVTANEEFCINESYQQQNSKGDIPQETTQTGLSQKSQMLVESYAVVMSQQMYMDDINRSASSTYSSVGMKSVGTTSVAAPQSISNTVSHIQPSHRKISKRVCKAVSQYYKGQFVDRWKCKTDSSPIKDLAAILVERDGKMKVVVFTAGTAKKGECSYSINSKSADECMWGHCDGHATSLCYRLASFYLITEMHEYKRNCHMSILEMQPGGYVLKKGIKLHFFITNVPCGFMDNEDHYFLSWKVPFKRKPHCLKCSSIILINAYLGIQGPLSHLFTNPVYISSITLLKNVDDSALKVARIKKRFEGFYAQLQKIDEISDSNYKFHIPHVEIADSKSIEFSECFKPYSRSNSHSEVSPTLENQTEVTSAAGLVPDVEGNLGYHMIISALNNGIGTDEFCQDMTLQLENASKDFPNTLKKVQLNSLMEAQQRLIEALNISKALENMRSFISKRMDERFTTPCKSTSEMVKQLEEIDKSRSIIEREVSVQVDKLKESVDTTMKSFDNHCDIPAVSRSLTSLSKSAGQIKNYSQLMIENLNSLNKSTKEFEKGMKSLLDELADSTLNDISDLLEKSNSGNCDHQFYLELMGCDWARSLGTIRNDIQKGSHGTVHDVPSSLSIPKDQQHQGHDGDVMDNTGRHIEQESQNVTVAEEESQKRTGKVYPDSSPSCAVMGYGLPQHVSSSPYVAKHGYWQQQCSLENENAVDKEKPVQEESETDAISPKECGVLNDDFTDFDKCKVSHNSVYQACSLPSLSHDEEQQQQGSKLVINSNLERTTVKIFRPQNTTTAWGEDQCAIIERKMVAPSMTAAFTAHAYTITQQKSEVTVPEVTASRSEEAIVSQLEITVPKIRKLSIASEVMRSPLMIMMFALLITVIFIYVVLDINWSNAAFYFDRYIENEFL